MLINYFFSCAETLSEKVKGAKFFLATDSSIVRLSAQKFFNHSLIMIPYKDKKESFSYNNLLISAAEIYILSQCDELLITPYSSFGIMAAAISGKPPHYITRNEGFCIKDIGYEPKCQYWHALSRDGIDKFTSSDTLNFDESFL